MHLKHSASIFSDNLNLTYKVLIFIFIVFIVASAIFVSIVSPLLKDIREAIEIEGLSLAPRDIFEDPVEQITQIWHTVSNFLSDNYALLISRFLFLVLLLVFARFFISLAFLPISKIIYSKMTTGYSEGLFSSMLSSLIQTIGYAFLSSIIYSIIDLLIGFFSLYVFFFFFKLINVSALMPATAIFLLLYSLRISLFSHWLPILCDGERNIFKALALSIKNSPRSLSTHFPIVLTITIIYFSIVMSCIIPTFAILPIVTFPMYLTMLCIVHLVCYFNSNSKKYYTDMGLTVFTPNKE